MTQQDSSLSPNTPTATPKSKERQFKGLSLSERKRLRREKLIQAGIEAYGQHGFFSVTVKDICQQAQLTERYFYESFKKSEQLFQCIFLQLTEKLQDTVLHAIQQHRGDHLGMIRAGLDALFRLLMQDPRIARIIYVDAMLVQELHNQATLRDTMARFDQMIEALINTGLPDSALAPHHISLMATGLNGYVTQIAVRWVIGGHQYAIEDVVASCEVVFMALFHQLQQQQ
ncbi:TetR/AcrR family transcriptional regulator [Acinetobacter larvae]|uniref:TetR family transcriptional regulator n=1 Tax=Acinetobacter larvae TaxID=1789224 RepID=A0A1B2M3L4_9GAMM|nr:TetR family transcriptional regulator [Acinetobacter larvae]AOA59774.1 TetR family transcriptional regulator [Acinetobacter larvae]